MGILSQKGHVGLRLQGDGGTYESPGEPGATKNLFFPVRGGSISGERELLVPDPEIGLDRDMAIAMYGPLAMKGEYQFYGRPRTLQLLLASVLGGWSSLTVGDLQEVNMFGEVDLPWLSIEEKVGDSFDTFSFWNCKVNTLNIECDAEGMVQGSADILGMFPSLVVPTAEDDRRMDTGEIYVGSTSTITIDGVNLYPKSVSCQITNNVEEDDFRLGTLYLGSLTERRREVTMTCRIRHEDSGMWRQAMWGSLSSIGGQPVMLDDLKWSMETYSTFTNGATTSPWITEINLAHALMEPFNIDPSGDDLLDNEVTFRMVRPDPTESGITALSVDDPDDVVVSGLRAIYALGDLYGPEAPFALLTEDGTYVIGP